MIRRTSGIATAFLLAVISVFAILIATGVYAVKNRHIWIAHGVTAAMNTIIAKSGLPAQEKTQVTDIIYHINQSYLSGEITAAELKLIFEGMTKSPALPLGLLEQFEQSYVVPSGLSNAEKRAADIDLTRLAMGLANGQISWDFAETILAGVSDQDPSGTYRLKAPAQVSNAEIREVLTTIKNTIREADISDTLIEVDISDEFKKSVEEALGRSLS